MKGIWETRDGFFKAGESYICGKWTVGSIDWKTFCKPTEAERRWIATCWLPGIPDCIGTYRTIEDAKVAVEHEVWYWFNNLEITK